MTPAVSKIERNLITVSGLMPLSSSLCGRATCVSKNEGRVDKTKASERNARVPQRPAQQSASAIEREQDRLDRVGAGVFERTCRDVNVNTQRKYGEDSGYE